ncbi:unnamed protein product [Miscanthus lutarioriparius]|uniref:Uncharacterized protein n=1 Tax=Miscanthus lutarioriparius TaxID=422564 RepID=A0A811PKT6_9POAL|nr:unnamed protein product [Miscanthus lutarioriparius]
MASTAFATAKFFSAHLDSSPRIAPHRATPTANLTFSPLSANSSSMLRLRSLCPSGPGGRLPPPPPPRSYGVAGGSGNAVDSEGGRRGGILGLFLAGWAACVAADPQFPFKVLMEELAGVTACVLGDMASRPNFGLNELDFVFSTPGPGARTAGSASGPPPWRTRGSLAPRMVEDGRRRPMEETKKGTVKKQREGIWDFFQRRLIPLDEKVDEMASEAKKKIS